MEPTKCNHTYETLGNRVFRCDADPHPNKPDAHYFVRDLEEQDRRNATRRQRRRLTVVPGQRGEQ